VSHGYSGDTTRHFSPVEGKEAVQQDVLVKSEGRPTKSILIGVSLDVGDLSDDNNDAWYVPWRDGIEAAEGKKNAKKKKKDLPVELLGTPKMWLDDSGNGGWVLLKAIVAEGHSSRRLEKLEMAVADEHGTVPVHVNDGHPVVWMSIPDLRRRVVPSEVLTWFVFDDDLCAAIQRASIAPHKLDVTVSGSEIRTTTGAYPLPPELTRGLAAACAGGGP
jgi:hypothetical protein